VFLCTFPIRRLLKESIALMARTLKDRFKIRDPKIAVLGLNPHAGEGGLLGFEDVKYILPDIRQAQAHGIKAKGSEPADTFFAFHGSYDGIVAMYHDQGLTHPCFQPSNSLVN
jgi:4-hydroxythreonine-4-phosphate dehydrogenase